MAYTEKDLQSFQRNILQPDDTFRFACEMCGNCCRKRREPIMINGADMFRIAQKLGISTEQVLQKYTKYYIGDSSHAPIVTLRERDDGSCSLLRKGRCMVHDYKPSVCALFPLGRLYDISEKKLQYFFNPKSCGAGSNNGKLWKLQEWIDEFHLEETAPMTEAWMSLFIGISSQTHKMTLKKIESNERLVYAMVSVLYLGYQTDAPFIPQVEGRKIAAQEIFQKEFGLKIKF